MSKAKIMILTIISPYRTFTRRMPYRKVNRTLKDIVNRMRGPIQQKLFKAINIYNNDKKHRAFRMRLLEAKFKVNKDLVLKNQ